MKRGLFLLVASLTVLLLGAAPTVAQVLVFSHTAGYRHAAIETGQEAFRGLAEQQGFRADFTEDAAWFADDRLAGYQAVVFLNTTGDVLDAAQQAAFERFIQAGGGFVGIHAAADTEYEWPWYGSLVGGYFSGHPNGPNVREGRVLVADADHAATAHLPATWVRSDEWYDYKAMNPAVHVLLQVDETSYKRAGENPAAAPRPIAWAHAYDGGRAFYTGLGHTAESYRDPAYLAHLWGGLQFAIGEGSGPDYSRARPDESRFTKTVLDSNLDEPMELEILPDGRLLFIERGGAMKVHDPAAGETKTVATLDVYTKLENGLMGVALDPQYAENHWIYVYYSDPAAVEQHLSRFVFDGETLDLDSEKVLLVVEHQRDQCCHSGGSVEFGPNGNLFVSVGDDTNPFASDGYAPIDERQGDRPCTGNDDVEDCSRSPWDGQKSPANPNDLRGKILRITPQPDGTVTIPEGNLFTPGTPGTRPEIYVMGNRNPFRIHIDQRTGYLYWGEVGPDAADPHPERGPAGHDEVNQAREAGFFGWPYFVADNKPYHDYDFATGTPGPPFDPAQPLNDSPNNTGQQILPPAQPAFIWYPYGTSTEFPLVGEGGRNAMAGPVYYYDDYPDNPAKLPRYYDGKLFIFDWMRDWIMAVTMDENGDYESMEPFMPATPFKKPMDLIVGQDGQLYLLEYGTAWNTQNLDARLVRIDYAAGNRRPVAHLEAEPVLGAAPLTVRLLASATTDPDGDVLTYAWDFGNGQTATTANAETTFEVPGIYTVSLTVSDPDGETNTVMEQILVGNTPPEVALTLTGNQTFFFDDATLDYALEATDAEDGRLGQGIAAEAVTVTLDYVKEGADFIMPAQGHAAAMAASAAMVGKVFIDQSDCGACHQVDAPSIGPSYTAVAERYQDHRDPRGLLVNKIIEGGGGVWGDQAMAPHPQLSVSQVEQMVNYILSLTGEAPAEGLPAEGTLLLDRHAADDFDGRYLLTASYTDRGGAVIGPLTARAMTMLRHPQVQAEDFDDHHEAMVFPVPEDTPGLTGPMDVLVGANGTYVLYRQLDLTGITRLSALALLMPGTTLGGTVHVRAGAPDGPDIGLLDLTQGAGAVTATTDLLPLTGKHDLYLVFATDAGDGPVAALDWIRFAP